MELLAFEGFIIPGLHFDKCTIWILNWDTNPTPISKIIEVWILWHNGKKTCYINPPEANVIVQKYHTFDEVIPSNINFSERASNIVIEVEVDKSIVLSLELSRRPTIKYRLLNVILKYANKDRIVESGRTETGMYYKTTPQKINSLTILKAKLNSQELDLIKNPPIKYSLGDGKSSKDPIINYCIHMLED